MPLKNSEIFTFKFVFVDSLSRIYYIIVTYSDLKVDFCLLHKIYSSSYM